MLEIMPGLPDNVLGVKAVGEVDDDDYEDVLEPALDDYLSRHDKIRFLYYLGPEFTGYESDAMWEDTKLGFRTLTKYERVAVVTDTTWVKRCVKAFGWLMPSHVRVIDVAELDAATEWTSESRPHASAGLNPRLGCGRLTMDRSCRHVGAMPQVLGSTVLAPAGYIASCSALKYLTVEIAR